MQGIEMVKVQEEALDIVLGIVRDIVQVTEAFIVQDIVQVTGQIQDIVQVTGQSSVHSAGYGAKFRRYEELVHNKVISGFRALRSSRSGHHWRGSNPRQKGPCRSQGGFTIHRATNATGFGYGRFSNAFESHDEKT
ncbi:hypothetical protein PoB_004617400 [Plakobranchus ocellatus]|uniref:Uncharacterized protein n=1 Tax=Plakobranchus ocellatus TaxID=259542 RepID=A0AAV4BHU9_9GAST|nr:hypothetical protein PoB_004617400 [Plakobranchus ocellatus]